MSMALFEIKINSLPDRKGERTMKNVPNGKCKSLGNTQEYQSALHTTK
jgi:hypothetical protein